MDQPLEELLRELKALRKSLKAETVPTVSKKGFRDKSNELGTRWHRDLRPKLRAALQPEVIEKYDDGFARLIKLSAPNNLRASYLETLNVLVPTFNDELLIPAKLGSFSAPSPSAFDNFFTSIGNSDESEYLAEAISCAIAGYSRAAAVMGWSAGIDRVHRKIEALEFQQFNVASARMASQQSGRFKKFNQVQNINSLSEIRSVFDTIVLWVIEGMGLIDSNQHTRLRSCFDMRCQGAHPGDAPITPFNLLSFFSDVDQIILSNPKFKI